MTTPPAISSRAYSRSFSGLAFGTFLIVSGAIGWSVRYMRGWFEGGRWEEGPIWWQIGVGGVLVVLGLRGLGRLLRQEWRVTPSPGMPLKYVGRGRTRRRLP